MTQDHWWRLADVLLDDANVGFTAFYPKTAPGRWESVAVDIKPTETCGKADFRVTDYMIAATLQAVIAHIAEEFAIN